MKNLNTLFCILICLVLMHSARAQTTDPTAEKMLIYQRSIGGWPKAVNGIAVDYKKDLSDADKVAVRADSLQQDATIDNKATSREIIYLVNAYKKTGNKKYLDAAEKGIRYLFKAQYDNGGWPQYYPRHDLYRHEITYNDNAMVNVLNILQDIAEGIKGFEVVNPAYKPKAAAAVAKGVDCILKTQILAGGKLTVWCAQYDEKTLKPAKARAYELISLSGSESVGIVEFLMRIKNPSAEIKRAITAAIKWFERAKIGGYDFAFVKDPAQPKGIDRVLVKSPSSDIWARFYDIETNQPFFTGRDGQPKKTVAEIEVERRTGYSWYGTWPKKLLDKIYPAWLKANQNTYPNELTVAQDGSGNYKTIQEAVNSVRDLGQERVTIRIKKGVYHEKLVIPSWKAKITLIGEGNENTIITNSDYSGKSLPEGKDASGKDKFGTFTSYTVLVEGDDFIADNLTIVNASGRVGQAVALNVKGDRCIIRNCRILGNQDTLYASSEHSRQFYQHCYIEGTTDFIFGQATAVFLDCTIKSLSNSYITAAATTPRQKFGFVFFNCRLIADSAVKKVYLGRPWRPYAKTVFINCKLGSHIAPEGWDPWKGDAMFPDKEKTAYYAEYKSKGPGASQNGRVAWSNQLTARQSKLYTIENILAGMDNWNPAIDR